MILGEGAASFGLTNSDEALPVWSDLYVLLHVLMLKEHVSITEVASSRLAGQDKVTNQDWGIIGLLDGENRVDQSAGGNLAELGSEQLFVVVSVGGSEVFVGLEDELEGELGVSNLLSVLSVGGHVTEAYVPNVRSSSLKLLSKYLRSTCLGLTDMVAEVILEEVPAVLAVD